MGRLELKCKIDKLTDGSSVAILDMNGSIDGATVKKFESETLGLCEKGIKYLILNFTHVMYMNSTGLGILVKVLDRYQENEGDMKLVKVPPKVADLFDMLGISSILSTYESTDEAINSLPAQLAASTPNPTPAPIAPKPIPAPPAPPAPSAAPDLTPPVTPAPVVQENISMGIDLGGIAISESEGISISDTPDQNLSIDLSEPAVQPEIPAPSTTPDLAPPVTPAPVVQENISMGVDLGGIAISESEGISISDTPDQNLSIDLSEPAAQPEIPAPPTTLDLAPPVTPAPVVQENISMGVDLGGIAISESEGISISDTPDQNLSIDLSEPVEISGSAPSIEEPPLAVEIPAPVVDIQPPVLEDPIEEITLGTEIAGGIPISDSEGISIPDSSNQDIAFEIPAPPQSTPVTEIKAEQPLIETVEGITEQPLEEIAIEEVAVEEVVVEEVTKEATELDPVISEVPDSETVNEEKVSMPELSEPVVSEVVPEKEPISELEPERAVTAEPETNTTAESKPVESKPGTAIELDATEEPEVEPVVAAKPKPEITPKLEPEPIPEPEPAAAPIVPKRDQVADIIPSVPKEVPSLAAPKPVSETLKRKATTRYYSQMNVFKSFPLSVVLSPDKTNIAAPSSSLENVSQTTSNKSLNIEKKDPIVTITPNLAGCLVSPPFITVDVTPNLVSTEFWVTPVTEGQISGKIDISYQGVNIDSIPVESKSAKHTWAKVGAVGTIVSPLISYFLEGFGWNLTQKTIKGFPKLVANIDNAIGLQTFGYISMAVFLVMGIAFYVMNQPKEGDATEHFFSFKT